MFVNECESNPCENGAVCTDSTSDAAVPADGYKCTCADGYASGWCEYEQVVPDYVSDCAISASSAAPTPGDGNCAIDVNECSSSPCENGAECSDSTSAPYLAAAGYRCMCIDGYSSGICTYAEIVASYTDQCSVELSSNAGLSPGDGNCAICSQKLRTLNHF